MKNNLFDRIVAPQVILCAVAIGFLGIFLDKSLLVDEDIVMLFQMNSMSDKINGWRPDVAYGMSNFFSDPGTAHPWSISGLWSSLFSDRVFGQNILFVILVTVACLSLYFFLRKIVPEVNKATLLFLALLIPFGSLRHEFVFLYCNIVQFIGASMGAFVLYQFLIRPRIRYYFYYIIIIWTLVFFGSSVSLFQFLAFTLFFSFGVFVYHGFYKKWDHFIRIVWRYLSINIIAGILLFFLGGWIFYGLLLEQNAVGYVRTSDYTLNSWVLSFEPLKYFLHIFSYFHAGYLSPWSGQLGIKQILGGHSWQNVSPITPVIIVICLFFKSRNFWEFSAKYVVFGAYLYHEIFMWFPGLFNYVQSLIHLYPPNKMYPFIQVYQIVLIAFVVDRLTSDNSWFDIIVKQKISRALALLLSFFYMGGLVFILFIKLFPEYLFESFLNTLPWMAKSFGLNLEFGETLVKENIRLLEETLGWADLLFYGTTLIIMGIFISRFGPSLVRFKGGFLFALVLLVNNYFLSLSVYPLNSQPLIWDKQQGKNFLNKDFFDPSDRLARVTLSLCRGHSDYMSCIKNKFFSKEFGAQRYQVGYRDVPSIELSRPTSFISQFNSKYIKKIMRDPEFSVADLRKNSIETSEYFWDLLNIGAVNYLLSNTSIPENKQLELVYKSKQFFLYRNIDAWPYYYFANRIKIIEEYEEFYEQKQGVAYLWENIENLDFLENQTGSRNIELVKFKHGDLEFQYKIKKPEFLVIADSWHPNWKASVNGKEVPIFKANGIFKGIALPSGEGKLNLLFDNSIYYPGIWVSFISWSVFFLMWGLFAFRLRKRY